MNPTTITSSQHRYILALKHGPKTTHDLVLSVMVTANSVTKMMRKLEERGIVQSEMILYAHGRRYQYELIESYDALISRVTIRSSARERGLCR